MNDTLEFEIINEDEMNKIKKDHNLKLSWTIYDQPMKAKINGKISGLLDWETEEILDKKVIRIHNFEVIEKGIGTGSEIFNAFLQELGKYDIYLYPQCKRSELFWRKHGFLPCDNSKTPEYIRKGNELYTVHKGKILRTN